MDAVITYVDMTPTMKSNYLKYCGENIDENRFRSYGILDLQVDGIRKYMPYINNIFVIVSDKEQVSIYNNLDAKIIEHKDIIPQEYLPLFNSCAIEMFMWNIPELDEEFIYFNDDMYVINDIPETDWFINGKPCLWPTMFSNNLCNPYLENNTYRMNCVYSTNLISQMINGKDFGFNYILQNHNAKPYLKSSCEKVFNYNKQKILNSITRTRKSTNYNCYIFNNYEMFKCNYIKKSLRCKYSKISIDINTIDYIFKEDKFKLICINDNDKNIDINDFKLNLRKLLEYNLYNR